MQKNHLCNHVNYKSFIFFLNIGFCLQFLFLLSQWSDFCFRCSTLFCAPSLFVWDSDTNLPGGRDFQGCVPIGYSVFEWQPTTPQIIQCNSCSKLRSPLGHVCVGASWGVFMKISDLSYGLLCIILVLCSLYFIPTLNILIPEHTAAVK